jgi:hypothetical protein
MLDVAFRLVTITFNLSAALVMILTRRFCITFPMGRRQIEEILQEIMSLSKLETLTIRQCIEDCWAIKIIVSHLRSLTFHGLNHSFLGRVDIPKLQMPHIARHGFNRRDQKQSLACASDNPTFQLAPLTLRIDCLIM